MQHGHLIEGHGFRLRPVADGDAAFVAALRSNPQLNRFIHASLPGVDAQLQWLAGYYQRPGDFCWIVEAIGGGEAQGTIAVYGIDAATHSAEWGRWVLRPGSAAAVESAWLIYRIAFEQLGLRSLYCRTVADNRAVVSFHDACGIAQRRLLPSAVSLHGQPFDAVEHHVAIEAWPPIDARLDTLARNMARRLHRAAA